MHAEDSIDEELLRAISNPSRLRASKKTESSDEENAAAAPPPGVIDVTDLLFTAADNDDVHEHHSPLSIGLLEQPAAVVHSPLRASPSPEPSLHRSEHHYESASNRQHKDRKHRHKSNSSDHGSHRSKRSSRHDEDVDLMYRPDVDHFSHEEERYRERQERKARRRERRAQRERIPSLDEEIDMQQKSPQQQPPQQDYYEPPHKARGQQLYEEEIQQSINDFTHFRMDNQRESEAIEKVELLSRMNQLERDGFPPIKRMTTATPLDEIRYELYRQARDSDRDKGLKSMRGYLVTGASLIEMFNSAFNPFDLRLEGFSTSVMMNAHEYDTTLAELHTKYSGRGSGMPPEMRLAMSLCFAVIVHHTSTAVTQSTSRANGAASMRNVAGAGKGGGGGGLAGLFSGGFNPMAMLSTMFGNRAAAVPATSIPTAQPPSAENRRKMQGPPDSD
jgi:hypothetical protein